MARSPGSLGSLVADREIGDACGSDLMVRSGDRVVLWVIREDAGVRQQVHAGCGRHAVAWLRESGCRRMVASTKFPAAIVAG